MKYKRLKVGAVDWKVQTTPIVGSSDKWGTSDYRTYTITLEETLPKQARHEVFLHELIHVADEQGVAPDDMLTETEVKRLGTALAAMFRDNPWLKEELFE